MKKLLALIGTAFVLAAPVNAQQVLCGPRDLVIEQVMTSQGLTLQSSGLNEGTSLVETWASLDTGEWVLTITMAAGVMCVASEGNGFKLVWHGDPA